MWYRYRYSSFSFLHAWHMTVSNVFPLTPNMIVQNLYYYYCLLLLVVKCFQSIVCETFLYWSKPLKQRIGFSNVYPPFTNTSIGLIKSVECVSNLYFPRSNNMTILTIWKFGIKSLREHTIIKYHDPCRWKIQQHHTALERYPTGKCLKGKWFEDAYIHLFHLVWVNQLVPS